MLDFSLLHASRFYELAALLALAAIIGFIGLLLHQPMIVSFIVVGVLAGTSVLGLVHPQDKMDLFAELGVTLLLFLVGMKLDIHLIRSLGTVSLATGIGQIIFTSSLGYFIGVALGLNTITALYVAVALTFSSTIIIVKLLSDKKEVDSLHGRIAIGFLIVQDIFVVLVMMTLSIFSADSPSHTSPWTHITSVLFYLSMILLLAALFIRYLASPLMNVISRSSELMVIFAIGWAATLAALMHHLGFSKELGGLLAGMTLASTPIREAIVGRLAPLRDFLLLFFFVALGAQLDLKLLGGQMFAALVFSVFVLIGNPLIVMAIMGYMGYSKRTGFLAGLTVAQISEFSLILMAMGITLGHVSNAALGIVTQVGFITIALSVYMITYSHSIYRFLEPLLGVFERKMTHLDATQQNTTSQKKYDIILFGLGRYGMAIAENFRKENVSLLGVDFNPQEVYKLRVGGYDAIFGDASDPEFISALPLRDAMWVISALPQYELGIRREDPRLVLIDTLKHENFAGGIAVATHVAHEYEILKKQGVDIVLIPFRDAADRAVERIRLHAIANHS